MPPASAPSVVPGPPAHPACSPLPRRVPCQPAHVSPPGASALHPCGRPILSRGPVRWAAQRWMRCGPVLSLPACVPGFCPFRTQVVSNSYRSLDTPAHPQAWSLCQDEPWCSEKSALAYEAALWLRPLRLSPASGRGEVLEGRPQPPALSTESAQLPGPRGTRVLPPLGCLGSRWVVAFLVGGSGVTRFQIYVSQFCCSGHGLLLY